MTDQTSLGHWVRRFLLEYAVSERNLSLNTRASVCDNEYWPTCADEYWPTRGVDLPEPGRGPAQAGRRHFLLLPITIWLLSAAPSCGGSDRSRHLW